MKEKSVMIKGTHTPIFYSIYFRLIEKANGIKYLYVSLNRHIDVGM